VGEGITELKECSRKEQESQPVESKDRSGCYLVIDMRQQVLYEGNYIKRKRSKYCNKKGFTQG
jgi:hypothetical protein